MSPVASALNERSEFRDEVPRVASAFVENRIPADENRKAKLCHRFERERAEAGGIFFASGKAAKRKSEMPLNASEQDSPVFRST